MTNTPTNPITCCAYLSLTMTNTPTPHLPVPVPPDELAAAAVGTTYLNLLAFFLFGVATALDTLGSQAHGAGDHAQLVTW